ncbi:MAG: hypothetical protein U9R44_03505 [Candidatus Omnitrophota bacterium]|nr:hypothetical protein [Candidatus Omnitrophota bacterium]
MNKRVLIVLVLTAMMFFIGTCVTLAQKSGRYGPGVSTGQDLEHRFFSEVNLAMNSSMALELSDEQVKQIKDLSKEVSKSLIRQDADIQTLTVEINTLMWEVPVNTEMITPLVAQKHELEKKKSQYLVSVHDKLIKIYTKNQLEKLKDLYKSAGIYSAGEYAGGPYHGGGHYGTQQQVGTGTTRRMRHRPRL